MSDRESGKALMRARRFLIAAEKYLSLIAKGCIYLLIGFPIVNYTLHLRTFGTLGSVWDTIVLLVLAAIAVLRYLAGRRTVGFAWSRFAWWYIFYCAALMVVGFLTNATVSFDGFSIDVKFILFGLLLPFVVEPRDIPGYLHGILTVTILLGVDGVFQYLTKVHIPGGWVDVGEHVRTRVFSVLGSPAELGATMEMTIGFLLASLLVDKHRTRRALYLFGLACCLATLLFTYSRGAWLGLSIGLLFVGVFFERRLILLLIAAGVVAFFVPSVHHRIIDLFSPVYALKSLQGGRIMRWQAAFETMSPQPLFGVGIGRYGGSIATAFHLSAYSDSYYAKVLGESGLVGLALFFSLQAAVVRELITTVVKRAQGRHRYLALGCLSGTIAILVHAGFENLFEYSSTAMLYYLTTGLFLLWGRTFDEPVAYTDTQVTKGSA